MTMYTRGGGRGDGMTLIVTRIITTSVNSTTIDVSELVSSIQMILRLFSTRRNFPRGAEFFFVSGKRIPLRAENSA